MHILNGNPTPAHTVHPECKTDLEDLQRQLGVQKRPRPSEDAHDHDDRPPQRRRHHEPLRHRATVFRIRNIAGNACYLNASSQCALRLRSFPTDELGSEA